MESAPLMEGGAEDGLDYFGARYLGSSLGRWMSPDVVNLTDERVENPANTLNKYAYGGNNPLRWHKFQEARSLEHS